MRNVIPRFKGAAVRHLVSITLHTTFTSSADYVISASQQFYTRTILIPHLLLLFQYFLTKHQYLSSPLSNTNIAFHGLGLERNLSSGDTPFKILILHSFLFIFPLSRTTPSYLITKSCHLVAPSQRDKISTNVSH